MNAVAYVTTNAVKFAKTIILYAVVYDHEHILYRDHHDF